MNENKFAEGVCMKQKCHFTISGLMLLIWFCLSGCESTQSLQNKWLGKSKDALLTAWGQPSGIEESPDGGTIYVYTKSYYPVDQEPVGYPSDPSPYSLSRDATDYPIKIKAESSTVKFWISPDGKIYRTQGRIIK